MAEVLAFRVPAGSAHTLLVWGLEPAPGLEHSLFSVFSKFGLLYSVRAHRNAAVAGPGYYAIIKFYSDRDASRAQRACNGQRLFQKSPLKVSKATDDGHNTPSYSILINYLWSSQQLQNVSGFDDENGDLGKILQKRSVKYLGAVEVTLPNHGVCTRGVGLGEADIENSEDPVEFVTATRRVQKLAVGKALSSAFQKILLVVLGKAYFCIKHWGDSLYGGSQNSSCVVVFTDVTLKSSFTI
uniref:RAD52 motif-containing protein 1 n=1 Tax=Anas zonorhyncha TaxID=75864 RepID=A0A8B9UD06_9AVES